jgi:hypothetical protein
MRLASPLRMLHLLGSISMSLSLSTLAVTLGLGFGLLQVYGLVNPAGFTASARKFPRSNPMGVLLMLLATGWFVWNVSQESVADFANIKTPLLLFFTAIGIGSVIFVRDFLAVRGLAVVLLLLAKLMVDTGRPELGSTVWVKLFQLWGYVLVFLGMWFTISPWRLRDFIAWSTANESRLKTLCSVRLAFCVLIAALGVLKF